MENVPSDARACSNSIFSGKAITRSFGRDNEVEYCTVASKNTSRDTESRQEKPAGPKSRLFVKYL